MSSIEGTIRINLYPQREGDSRVMIQAQRPVTASRVLQGKTPRQVLQIVPMMYSVCSTAQARAALRAISSRIGIDPDPLTEQARDALVWVENAREHLFQILVQWSDMATTECPTQALALLGAIKPRAALALFSDGRAFELEDHLTPRPNELRLLIDDMDATLRKHVFGMDVQTWLQIEDLPALQDWAQTGTLSAPTLVGQIIARNWGHQGHSEIGPLPELPGAELASILGGANADAFVTMPTWHGSCRETSVLSRQLQHPLIQALAQDFGHGLITRISARLVELAGVPMRLRRLAELIENRDEVSGMLPACAGLGETDAARGKLFHYVETKADQVSHYRILAPTEWNFHPSGVAAQSLAALHSDDSAQLEHLARLLISAIDPCVSYQLKVH